ncbi:MAG: DedA family protein [Anaerolineales bacterium]
MLLENILPIIPSEGILPMAGWLAFENKGNFTLLGITLVGTIGSVGGALLFYGLGYWFGEQRVRILFRRYGKWLLLKEKDFDTSLAWFNRYGERVIFLGRMVPIVRSLVSIPAGIARMNLGVFNIYTALGTALWSFLLSLAGYLLGKNWTLVMDWISRYEMAVLILIIAVFLIFIVRRIMEHRTKLQDKV